MITCKRTFAKKALRILSVNARGYAVVGLDTVTDSLDIPNHIQKPSYYRNGIPSPRPNSIDIKTDEQIRRLKVAGALAGSILDKTLDYAEVGMTTDELDKYSHHLIITSGAYPAPYNYRGFPKSICTSVNNVLCHGIPNTRPLENGDILSVDVSVYYDGVFGDCCSNRIVGEGDVISQSLVSIAKDSVLSCLEHCRPGSSFSIIGKTISKIVHDAGFSVCKEFVGHGIGEYFHGMPHVYHYDNDFGPMMQKGMVFTIEPILMEGRDEMRILSDGWTAVTADGKCSTQFEHTVLVTDSGVEIISPHG